jgi:pyridoxamine 5'-phosphate oxidase-like protein
MELPDSARLLVESARLAHLVTLNPNGSPQVSCVWVGLDGGEIVSGHLFAGRAHARPPARLRHADDGGADRRGRPVGVAAVADSSSFAGATSA